MSAPSPALRPLSYDDALATALRIAEQARRPHAESVALDVAIGRALATDIVSALDLPHFDNAGMDGFAVRRSDVEHASNEVPVRLAVIGASTAGTAVRALPNVATGTAVRIMTGAPIPPGADAVIRIEDTAPLDTHVDVLSPRDLVGRGNIRPRGEDVRAGERVFAAGESVTAAHVGVLASVGVARVSVTRRPRVAIVSGGDELVLLDRFDEVLAGDRLVSSSSYALPALLESAVAEVVRLPLVPDTLDAMVGAIDSALSFDIDLLVTTGGVSVGAHDFTKDALTALGGHVTAWRARIRPGGPLGLGSVRGVPWIGLPGNPVSTMVTGLLFAWPMLRVLGGYARVSHRTTRVRFVGTFTPAAPLLHFARVRLSRGADGMAEAVLAGAQGSNLLRAFAHADALMLVPETCARAEPGMEFEAILLPT